MTAHAHHIEVEPGPAVARGGRWTPARKAEVVRQVLAQEVTLAEASERHQLGAEEISTWLDRFARLGISGLHLTKIQAAR